MLENLSDSELVTQFHQSGHKTRNQILLILFDRYKYLILKLSYGYLKDYENAKDALHDVFVKIVENLDGLRTPEVFKSWALTIAKNTCVDILRRTSVLSGGELLPLKVEPHSGTRVEDITVAQVEKKRILEHLRNCLEKLSPFDLNVFSLRCEGLRTADICSLLRIERAALRRSYERIRKILELCMRRRKLRLSIDEIVAVGMFDE